MQDIIIEEPYRFVPPSYSTLWPKLIRRIVPWYIRKSSGVHSIETRGAEKLRASLEAGKGVLLAPNHSRMSDPLTFTGLCDACGCHMHAMASWHLFKKSRVNCFMLRRIGAFSVHRESPVDMQAMKTAVDILVDGRRPLVVFAEGAISRHNDVLMPMMDGTAFLARQAAKRREKTPGVAGVVVHPVAIRYFYRGDLQQAVEPVLEEIESHFSWFPQRDKSLVLRLRQIGQALLSLKEVEYFGVARTGDFYERVDHLIQDVLAKLERQWNVKDSSGGVVARVKTLRAAILPSLIEDGLSEQDKDLRRKQLAACYYVQQMSHYPRNYVRLSQKNVPEHILETVERFEEDFTDRVRIHGPLHAVVQVGDPIDVDSRRDRSATSDPLMDRLRDNLQGMLTELSAESPKV
jgi:1-acyl-sn-glycerol-3-phosphate acyltransferase